MKKKANRFIGRAAASLLTAMLAAAVAIPATIRASGDQGRDHDDRDHDDRDHDDDAPIRHVVVIFQENVSFDHSTKTTVHTDAVTNDSSALAAA